MTKSINVVVDLSHHNENVDFAKMKANGIVGVIHKATQGLTYVDKTYAKRRAMDNFVYGLTKKQTSPTSPIGFKSKTDPQGSIDQPVNAMTLYGTRSLTAPTISGLSASTLAQAGRLTISGSGFGEDQNDSIVQIGGAFAPVSDWSDVSITAYVPDSAALGTDNVQVITSGGSSNTLQLTVTARPLQVGHGPRQRRHDSQRSSPCDFNHCGA